MVNKKSEYPVPKFNNLEEEDKYWQTHSPLVEGYKGSVQRKQQNRNSFLSIRLTGEELASLRDKAMEYGLGPSTYARLTIKQGIESRSGSLPPPLLIHLISQAYRIKGKSSENYVQQFNEICKRYLETQEDTAQQLLNLCISDLFISLEESEGIQDKVIKP